MIIPSLYPVGVFLLLFIPGAIVGVIRAKRRNESTLGVLFSGLAIGFISAAVIMLVGFVALMVLWGLSI